MSFVGPRPCSIQLNAHNLWQCERLEVPPGITGLWQIEGRGTSFDEQLRWALAFYRSVGASAYIARGEQLLAKSA